jgi:hypothetical protein
MCSQHGWGNAPHVLGIALEELSMRRTFEVASKFLMNWEIVVICLISSVPVGIVLDRMEFFNGSTELRPRALAARR